HTAPRDRGLQVVAGERLALAAQRLRILRAAECEQRAAEERRGLRAVDRQPVLAEARVHRSQRALGGDRVPLEELDQAREDVDLEDTLRDPELLDHAP